MDDQQLDINDIYEKYYRDVYHFALYFTNNKQEAEDITQETFVKIIKSIGNLKSTDKLKTWILSITKNTAMDLHRKKKFIRLFPDWGWEKEKDSFTPEDRLIQKGEWTELQSALLSLKQQYRTVVILRGLKELSIKETAEVLGCSETKVRVDYHRALQLLKKQVLSNEEGWGLHNGQS
ncbi:RNA polymerase sigma factor [Mesobacillus subterraneus]|uniref:RNA polymerase sigma factor n=1 Tax=Mesobacillus subterraneus TaxID=285983 RepID=A0A3R9FDE1_9BACI|nr:RNA polymerase sigma factor [Mesobacillus subterraneus]RSD25495.1 RNA polymerase sigma factor [Mesobacillus subterraneus]